MFQAIVEIEDLTQAVISYEIYVTISYEMITSVRISLSYDHFKSDFIAFNCQPVVQQKRYGWHGRRNEVTCSHQSVM